MIPFPDKKYDIIYADPPWSYSDKGCNGNAAEHYDGHAGIIQQFIFYYMQQHKGGKTT